MENVADRYRRLSTAFAQKVGAVPPGAWESESPCEEWTARQLLWHVVDVHARFQSLVGRTVADHPSVEADPVGAFAAVRDQMQADLDDPHRRDEEYEGRFGRARWSDSVEGFVCFDLVVHGWDLARAAGLDDTIEPEDVAWVQSIVDARGEAMRANNVIKDPVAVPASAPAQDRLLAALGRRR
jgi:uncharacterized protein (TIGR03086 family)